MQTLKQFDDARWAQFKKNQNSREPHPNGIACPVCDKELWDSDPMLTLTSNPPQKQIHCQSCKFSGYRLA